MCWNLAARPDVCAGETSLTMYFVALPFENSAGERWTERKPVYLGSAATPLSVNADFSRIASS